MDVKGQAQKSSWLLKPNQDCGDRLYYILVYLPHLALGKGTREPDRFFILTQEEANRLESNYRASHPNQKTTMPGFSWKDVDSQEFEDKWDKLPKEFGIPAQ